MGPAVPGMPQPTKEQELQMLKEQANFMKQEMDEINKRLNELSKNK